MLMSTELNNVLLASTYAFSHVRVRTYKSLNLSKFHFINKIPLEKHTISFKEMMRYYFNHYEMF
jgi:hypothetical protein